MNGKQMVRKNTKKIADEATLLSDIIEIIGEKSPALAEKLGAKIAEEMQSYITKLENKLKIDKKTAEKQAELLLLVKNSTEQGRIFTKIVSGALNDLIQKNPEDNVLGEIISGLKEAVEDNTEELKNMRDSLAPKWVPKSESDLSTVTGPSLRSTPNVDLSQDEKDDLTKVYTVATDTAEGVLNSLEDWALAWTRDYRGQQNYYPENPVEHNSMINDYKDSLKQGEIPVESGFVPPNKLLKELGLSVKDMVALNKQYTEMLENANPTDKQNSNNDDDNSSKTKSSRVTNRKLIDLLTKIEKNTRAGCNGAPGAEQEERQPGMGSKVVSALKYTPIGMYANAMYHAGSFALGTVGAVGKGLVAGARGIKSLLSGKKSEGQTTEGKSSKESLEEDSESLDIQKKQMELLEQIDFNTSETAAAIGDLDKKKKKENEEKEGSGAKSAILGWLKKSPIGQFFNVFKIGFDLLKGIIPAIGPIIAGIGAAFSSVIAAITPILAPLAAFGAAIAGVAGVVQALFGEDGVLKGGDGNNFISDMVGGHTKYEDPGAMKADGLDDVNKARKEMGLPPVTQEQLNASKNKNAQLTPKQEEELGDKNEKILAAEASKSSKQDQQLDSASTQNSIINENAESKKISSIVNAPKSTTVINNGSSSSSGTILTSNLESSFRRFIDNRTSYA